MNKRSWLLAFLLFGFLVSFGCSSKEPVKKTDPEPIKNRMKQPGGKDEF